MTELWQKVSARMDSYTEDIVRFQTELVAESALGPDNGGQGELKKTILLEKWLDKLSPDETIRLDSPDPRVESGLRPNLAGLFKGRGPGRVWVLSHVDIVPPGELSLWESPPFVLRRDGDRIFGRGVEDNHQGLVSSYFAMKALRDEGVELPLDVGLVFVADEETGSAHGLQYILEQRPGLFSEKDLIVVPDSGDKDGTMIEVAEKSICWLRFTVSGKQCHASTPNRGINTMRATARMIVALDEGLPRVFDARDELFNVPFSTFEPTKKDANVPNVNTIPGEDVFYFDARVLPVYSLEDIKAEALKIAAGVARETGTSVKLDTLQEVQAPPATPTDAPVVRALARAVAEVKGREAQVRGIGGGTVAAFFRQKGLPAAVWSTVCDNAHAPNEYTHISSIISDAKVLARLFLGY
ncbi:MAG: M20 family metallo-hydrolase [Pseudomonadota bacterium]